MDGRSESSSLGEQGAARKGSYSPESERTATASSPVSGLSSSADIDMWRSGSAAEPLWDNHAYVYQTQRWFPIVGWGAHRLPTDLPEWSDESRHEVKLNLLHPPTGYTWSAAWKVDAPDTNTHNEAELGWEYSPDWSWKYHTKQKASDCVRKRRWKRGYHLDYPRTIELTNAADGLELVDGIIMGTGSVHQLKQYRGWRMTRLGHDDVSQASAAFTVREPVAVVVEPVPVERQHFLSDVYFMTRCTHVSPTGEKLRGALCIGSEQASFVSHPLTMHKVINYRDCRKVRVYEQQQRAGVVKFAENGSDAKFVLRTVDRPHETFCQLKKAASRFTTVLGGSEGNGCVSAASSLSGDRHDKGARLSTTSSGPPVLALSQEPVRFEPEGPSLSTPVAEPGPRTLEELNVDTVAHLFALTETEQHFTTEGALLDKVLTEQMLPTHSLEAAWDSLFSDSSDFLTTYHKARGEYTGERENPQPCVMPPWGPVSVASANVEVGYRVTEYTVPVVTAFVKQHTLQVERQRYVRGSNLFIVRFSSQTPNMIAGDCFRAETAVIVTQTPAGCVMKVVGDVTFLKSTWLKSKISSTAAKEMTTAYTQLAKAAASRLASAPAASTIPTVSTLTRSPTPVAEAVSPLPARRAEVEMEMKVEVFQETSTLALPSLIALMCVVFVVVYAAASVLSIDLVSANLGDFAAVSSSIAHSCPPGSDNCQRDANVSLQLLLDVSSASNSAVSTALANARFAVVAMLGLYIFTAVPLLYVSSKRLRP